MKDEKCLVCFSVTINKKKINILRIYMDKFSFRYLSFAYDFHQLYICAMFAAQVLVSQFGFIYAVVCHLVCQLQLKLIYFLHI